MRKQFIFYTLLLCILFVPSGCSVFDYIKRNCTVKYEASFTPYVCFFCDFTFISPTLREAMEKKLTTIKKEVEDKKN